MAGITIVPFGETEKGEQTALYTIVNAKGASATICSYGGAIVSLKVPDREGKLTDVVLGYDQLKDYEQGKSYFGALVGRCGNRIAGGKVTIAGKQYSWH